MQFTDEQQRFIDEHYQLLPVDADGVPIRVGDVVEFIGKDYVEEVVAITFTGYCWWVTTNNEKDEAKYLRHHRAPTALDTLLELLNEYRDGGGTMSEARLSEFAARLRLAGDGD